ncbi:unnamed protein product [Symbiodinium microadriaticum]|nr:unnamed protein product [Symbiodinium microadriaticum]
MREFLSELLEQDRPLEVHMLPRDRAMEEQAAEVLLQVLNARISKAWAGHQGMGDKWGAKGLPDSPDKSEGRLLDYTVEAGFGCGAAALAVLVPVQEAVVFIGAPPFLGFRRRAFL